MAVKNESLSQGWREGLAKIEAWDIGHFGTPPQLRPGLSSAGWLRLASGSLARPGNH
jgi:hypothetical protein